jgi:hypothetical protein
MKREEKFLWIFSILYSSFFLLKKLGIYYPLFSDFAADLICIPLSLLFIEWFSSKISNRNLEIGILHVFVAILYFTIVFEFWMPSISKNYTADYWDIVCYLIGGIIYWILFSNKKISTETI